MPNIVVSGSILLPPSMVWEDEFTPVKTKMAVATSLTGAAIVQVSKMQYGRPITLSSRSDGAWVKRSALNALYALQASADVEANFTFSLALPDGRTYTVAFNATGDDAITATPIQPGKFTSDDDYFNVKLKFIEM